MRDRQRLLVIGAALVTVCLWASAFVGIRSADRHLSSGALALGRLVIGSAVLGLFLIVRRDPLPRGRAILNVAVCGLLWFALYNVVLNEAEKRIDAGIAAMLVNVGPILIAILAGVVLKEGFPQRLVSGCIVSFAGAVVIGVATSRHGLHEAWGAVLCLIAALAYAGGVVAQKPVLDRSSALSVTFLACVTGAVSCLPFAPSLVHGLSHAPAGAIAWTVYLGAAPTAIGFVTWAYALKRTTAGRMGSTTYLVPPLAVLLGWALLDEVPPLLVLPGGLLCLAGVALARSRSRSRSSAGPVVRRPHLPLPNSGAPSR